MPARDGTTVFVQEYAKRRLKLQITSVLSVCWHLKSCDHDLEYYVESPAFTLPPFDLSPFFFCIRFLMTPTFSVHHSDAHSSQGDFIRNVGCDQSLSVSD